MSAVLHHTPVATLAAVLAIGLAVSSVGPAVSSAQPETRPAAATTSGATTTAATTTATTAQTMAASILGWMNRDRVARGLRPYRSWTALANVAVVRASRMAARGVLSHTVAGSDIGAELTAAHIPWYSFGEIIGTSSYPWGSQSAANLYSMWKSSAIHRSIMYSATFNYAGVGIVRASNGSTWASILFTASPDHTRPYASNGSLSASGTTVSYAWSGADVLLQTRTAGLRAFNVEYAVDYGTWHVIRSLTTARSLSLANRPHGHHYSFRVQSVDWRSNLSAWTAAKVIWIP